MVTTFLTRLLVFFAALWRLLTNGDRSDWVFGAPVIAFAASFASFAAAGLTGSAAWADDRPVAGADPIELPAIEGARPWNNRPVLASPGRFHFAVMTDNTGGHRPGIWLQGIRHVNLLRPEFVVSVGDLIEGYSEDRAEVEKQWKEFLGEMDEIDMRFFFVPGNHDLSNPLMHEIWREKFGREWYSFDYQGVHFLCLCSEDPETRIGDEQLAWILKDLDSHRDARWTFAFLHKPLWVAAERALAAGNPDPTNWKRVEEALKDRPHTVFAGHVHHYVQYDRNGANYYHLATTGGGSQLRGIPYGEFDHVTWVTMEQDGPRVAHVLLGGLLAPDAVTEQGIARFRRFLDRAQVRVAPVLEADADALSKGTIRLEVSNRFETPVRIRATIQNLPLKGLALNPERIEYEAQPGEARELPVEYSFQEPVPIEQIGGATIVATIRTVEDAPLTAETSLPVAVDRLLACARPARPVQVDGDLAEWKLEHKSPRRPVLFGNVEGWNGPGDASMAFALGYDDENLYFAGQIVDDRVVPGKDRVYLRLDARPLDERIANPRYARGCYRVEAAVPEADGPMSAILTADDGGGVHPVAAAAYKRTAKGYNVEIAVPLANLVEAQGPDWKTFQFTAGLADVDDSPSPTFVLWRGSQGVLERNTNFAHFIRR